MGHVNNGQGWCLSPGADTPLVFLDFMITFYTNFNLLSIGYPNNFSHSCGVIPVIRNSLSSAEIFGMANCISMPFCQLSICSFVTLISMVFSLPDTCDLRVINILVALLSCVCAIIIPTLTVVSTSLLHHL